MSMACGKKLACRFAAALIVAAVTIAGCRPTPPTLTAPSASFDPAPMPSVPPLAYFERACAGCHGPFGMFYGDTFAKGLDDEQLRRVVREMVEGPAQSTLDELSLASLTAFHFALREQPRRPFLVVASIGESQIKGEVSPGSTVRVRIDDRVVDAAVDGFAWSADVASGWQGAESVIIEASAEGDEEARTTLELGKASFSHAPDSQAAPPAPAR